MFLCWRCCALFSLNFVFRFGAISKSYRWLHQLPTPLYRSPVTNKPSKSNMCIYFGNGQFPKKTDIPLKNKRFAVLLFGPCRPLIQKMTCCDSIKPYIRVYVWCSAFIRYLISCLLTEFGTWHIDLSTSHCRCKGSCLLIKRLATLDIEAFAFSWLFAICMPWINPIYMMFGASLKLSQNKWVLSVHLCWTDQEDLGLIWFNLAGLHAR